MTHDLNMSLAVWSDIFYRLGTMMLVAASAILYALLLSKYTGKRQPRGVVFFGVLLIMGSVYKLWGFMEYGYYRFMFQQLSEQAIFTRYLGSVTLRFAGLAVATGVLLMKDPLRKCFIALCALTLCTLYWKHPFYVFENIARHTEEQFFGRAVTGELTNPLHPWISMIFSYAVDALFCASALFYFTRPKVKEQFRR